VSADGTTARFADGSTTDVASVIWATGFRLDHAFIDAELTRGHGGDPHLHFIGLPWQRSRGSALLGFVGADAAELAGSIATADAIPRIIRKSGTSAAITCEPRDQRFLLSKR
jgi:putative flavoprotein involved in K+ transport